LFEIWDKDTTINLTDGTIGRDIGLKGTFTRPNGTSAIWTRMTFPSGFIGKWKRDNFNNTLTFQATTLKSSSQNYTWTLNSISDDKYIIETGDYISDGVTIKLVNGNLVISGDSGSGQDNWNGTWKKQ